MSWKQDRDALIAETMAFVQSVAARRAEISKPETGEFALLTATEALDGSARNPAPLMEVKVAETLRSAPSPAPRPIVPGEMANEIRARIAGFRAHQERFSREREKYFNETLARLKATLNEASPLPRPEK
jgi:hypothetical protein